MGGVVLEAVVGDADRREPRVEEVGVAVAVVLERVGGGVELAAVEFDDEVVFSVDGVDFVAGDGLVSLGEREAVALEEAGEVVFELGSGGAPLGREAGCAAARVSGEEGGQLLRGDESLDLGLVEGSGESFRGEDVGEVDERAERGGDADAVVDGGVWVGGAVDEDPLSRCLVGAVTSVGVGQRGTIRHSAAAERWLSTASGPQASTAAIAVASGEGGR